MSEEVETGEDATLRELFRFLRERVYAVSRTFVDRVLGGVEDTLAKPAESFATPFLVEMLNLASSTLEPDAAPRAPAPGDGEDEDPEG
jgi:hypothetical protein